MCGIVGFLAKPQSLRARLGEAVVPMLLCMTERGPDSTGLALFTQAKTAAHRFNIHWAGTHDWDALLAQFRSAFDPAARIELRADHAIILAAAEPGPVRAFFARVDPAIRVLSVGHAMDIYKDIGPPATVAGKYGFKGMSGSHAVGHTRMATESAVSLGHAHPFTTGTDFCLVPIGSLSNYHSLLRSLERRGILFVTDNDTEAACRFFEWHMREGDTLEQAIVRGFGELDGFYTLLMATDDRLVLVRDAFACKPAVVAETDDYVAVASEFRSLAHLPGIGDAEIFEPQPERIYSWAV
ncbi:MAG: amidophosphoribosyltransferase [Planctomycetota bacterium]|nr:amidophosphoribosyltransferase [Planctomycetota bacterium]